MVTDYLMDYLKTAEGDVIHYNKTESDITAPYGIYRASHSEAKIFQTIDAIAKNLGITIPSPKWTSKEMDLLNNHIKNTVSLQEQLRAEAKEFYDGYISIPLEAFPEHCQVTVFSLYVNSPTNCIKAVQMAFNNLIKNFMPNAKDYSLAVDGKFGKGSTAKVKELTAKLVSVESQLYFETLILLAMSKLYATLAVKNPDKYLKYLNGWNNRLETLTGMV